MIVFVSPHLDDAVFSCGTLIAALALTSDVAVVTVFGGTDERRLEDERACEMLDAKAVHCDLSEGATAGEVTAALDIAEVQLADTLFMPLGIRHADHKTVAQAWFSDEVSYRYEELPYRVLWPEHLPHPMPQPILELPASAVKMAAVACYQSQLGGPAGEALWAGERYHRA